MQPQAVLLLLLLLQSLGHALSQLQQLLAVPAALKAGASLSPKPVAARSL
jgi:hypothetical protein